MSTDVQVVDTGLDKQSRRRSKDTEKAHRRSSNFQNKKHKHDHKFRKKIASNGKFFPPYKKRNKDFIIPPTKFLLGGNITDPLNLNSLQDEDINRAMNAVTPKSSPLPTPKHRKGEVEVIIPPDITDPLNLISGDDDATYEAMLTSPFKKTAKKQKKNKKRRSHRSSSGPGSGKEDSIEGAKLDQTDPSPAKEEKTENQEESKKDVKTEEETKDTKETPQLPPPAKRHKSDNNRANLRKIEFKERKADLDKIVSPVVPQPGAWNDRHRFRPPQRTPQIDKSQAKEMPKFKESNAKFQYGNYCRYYGYRNPNQGSDVRFRVFEKHKDLFEGKDVLDIGCNTGHLTLAVARDFRPNRVVGMDIDRSLITAARSNIRHYVNCGKKDKFFPVSMPIVYGPIDIPGVNEEKEFPHNISFVQGNYVLESDVLLSLEQPQFDVIMCLSITKWIQLNWGDAGLKRAFKRMFAQLRPGGVLILEAQSWSSYTRKRNLTPDTWKNYHAVELFPHQFSQYLLSEVGFSKCEVMGAPVHPSRGFQRPIKMFTKEDPSFDTPRPLGCNTERFESYSFRLPDSVHCPDDFSGDSNFPYETPNSINSSESGFSEGLHPRRYHLRYPMMDEVAEDGGGEEETEASQAQGGRASTSEEWRPISAGDNTLLSADSSSQGNIEEVSDENISSQDGERLEAVEQMEVSEVQVVSEQMEASEQSETNRRVNAEHNENPHGVDKGDVCKPNGETIEDANEAVQSCQQIIQAQGEGESTTEEWRATSGDNTMLSVDSSSQGNIEEVSDDNISSQDGEQPEAVEQVVASKQSGTNRRVDTEHNENPCGMDKGEVTVCKPNEGAIGEANEVVQRCQQIIQAQGEGASTTEEWRPISAGDNTVLSVDSSCQGNTEEVSNGNISIQDGERLEAVDQIKASEQSDTSGLVDMEHSENPCGVDKGDVKVCKPNEETIKEASEAVQRCQQISSNSDSESLNTKEKCGTINEAGNENGSSLYVQASESTRSEESEIRDLEMNEDEKLEDEAK